MYFTAVGSVFAGKLNISVYEGRDPQALGPALHCLTRWDSVDCLRDDSDGSNALVTMAEALVETAAIWPSSSSVLELDSALF